jgi:hypothetical protein
MSGASSAAEMIRRFREGPPISREDRAAAMAEGNAPNNMWWSTSNKRGGEGNDISLRKDSHSHINVKSDPLEQSEGSEPRIGSTLQRPEPAASRSISPMSRIAKYEGELHYYRFHYRLTLEMAHVMNANWLIESVTSTAFTCSAQRLLCIAITNFLINFHLCINISSDNQSNL